MLFTGLFVAGKRRFFTGQMSFVCKIYGGFLLLFGRNMRLKQRNEKRYFPRKRYWSDVWSLGYWKSMARRLYLSVESEVDLALRESCCLV